jgi:hypothetical protein
MDARLQMQVMAKTALEAATRLIIWSKAARRKAAMPATLILSFPPEQSVTAFSDLMAARVVGATKAAEAAMADLADRANAVAMGQLAHPASLAMAVTAVTAARADVAATVVLVETAHSVAMAKQLLFATMLTLTFM